MATGGGENTQVERVPTPPIPEGCQVLSHQVAGHMHGHGRSKAGMLQHLDGTILKPTQCPPKGQRELDFYTELFREDQDEPVMLSLQYYVPRFRGIFTTPSNPDTIYMKLDDATQKFHKPCIVDVKMGRRCYEDGAPVEKVELALKKYPPVEQVGFQILGMRIYHPSVDQYVFYDKTYGRSLDEDQVIEGKINMI
ncbi:inositol polyphosphate multikinase-like [Saccoglossus kowalevskii]|uniref:Kinase n=1 Tax=Saccoglossus kowalevskii TaxID=10224 RepID=A0ABM0GU10_SACKO|nr:PREDICTED: inositol polyphosphate multikinase-like [Saccoglossus kowalevskii]